MSAIKNVPTRCRFVGQEDFRHPKPWMKVNSAVNPERFTPDLTAGLMDSNRITVKQEDRCTDSTNDDKVYRTKLRASP